MIRQALLYSRAEEFIGIPYVFRGRDKTGLDCLGLLWLFYKENGINIPDTDGHEYNEGWSNCDPDRYLNGLLTLGSEINKDILQPLDLVYFTFNGHVTHTGVMLDRSSFLHILKQSPVCISSLSGVWLKRLAGARRLI